MRRLVAAVLTAALALSTVTACGKVPPPGVSVHKP